MSGYTVQATAVERRTGRGIAYEGSVDWLRFAAVVADCDELCSVLVVELRRPEDVCCAAIDRLRTTHRREELATPKLRAEAVSRAAQELLSRNRYLLLDAANRRGVHD